jgi:phage/plasmid-like protein (TIGR03299 family)
MTHGLVTDSDTVAYVGDTPWHGMGARMVPGMSRADWLTAAGLDYTIERAPVVYMTGANKLRDARTMDDRFVLFRSDTGAALGVVSDRYHIAQPAAVIDFFDEVAHENNLQLETAGCLFGGTRYWALARGAEHFVVGDRDTVYRFVLLSTSADGSMATEGRHTSKRVVCENTLTAARRGSPAAFRVKHNRHFDAGEGRESLGLADFEHVREIALRAADISLSQVDAMFRTLELVAPDWRELDKPKAEKVSRSAPVRCIMSNFLGGGRGAHLDGSRGTAWGWLNAVTEYVDHDGRGHTPDGRLASAWYGKGDTMKNRAAEIAVMETRVSADGGAAPAPIVRYVPVPRHDAGLLDAVLAATVQD